MTRGVLLLWLLLFPAGRIGEGAGAGPFPPRPFRPPLGRFVETFVPSEAAPGKGIAVRITLPRRPRYAEGAPVVIHVPGGFGAGGRLRPTVLSALGFVEVAFAFPGGRVGPQLSGGTYDLRGKRSLRALCDVVRFAEGLCADSEGRTINDLLKDCKALTTNVGIVGWSNGGNTCGAALVFFGKEMKGLGYYVSMESPYGDGAVAAELGTHETGVNPAYDRETGRLDLSKLAFDPHAPVRTTLRRIRIPEDLRGALFFDMNGSGRYEEGADFPASAFVAGRGSSIRLFYSLRLLGEAEKRNLFQPVRPSFIADLQDAQAFWRLRDPTPLLDRVGRTCPNLAVIVYAGIKDHVQVAPDHPHILAQVEGFMRAGIRFVRLNPDRAYVKELLRGRLPPGVPDNDAGKHYTRKTIVKCLEPEEVPRDLCVAAACVELADRIQKAQWAPNLSEVLLKRPLRLPPRPEIRPRPRPGRRRLQRGPQRISVPYGSGTKEVVVDCSQCTGTIRSLLGTNRGPYEYRRPAGKAPVDLVSSYRFLGIDFIRTHDFYGPTDWYVMFPRWEADPEDPRSYDFSSSDVRIRTICGNGFKCLFRLGTSWKGRNPRPINDPPGTLRDASGNVVHKADSRDFKKWGEICAQVVRHYTKGWNEGFRFPIRYWEIWNEPDLRSQFWTGTPQQYYKLYEEAARAVKKVDPALKVGGPACTGALRKEYVEDFIRYCRDNEVPLDFFSWHSYGGRGRFNPYNYAEAAKRIRQALDSFGFKETENICDEWNAGIGPGLFSDKPAACPYYASTLAAFLDSGVTKAFQYCGDMHPGLGLHDRKSGEPKRCAYAFAAWKLLLQTPVRINADGSDKRGYAVVAGKSADGKLVRVLISDFQSGYEAVHLTVKNLPWPACAGFKVRRLLLDESHLLEVVQKQRSKGRAWECRVALRSPAVCLFEFRLVE